MAMPHKKHSYSHFVTALSAINHDVNGFFIALPYVQYSRPAGAHFSATDLAVH